MSISWRQPGPSRPAFCAGTKARRSSSATSCMFMRRSRIPSSRSTSTTTARSSGSMSPSRIPNVIPVMCCDTVNRGLSYADGKIFLHQADTTLVALDAKTGKVVWSVKDGDPSKGETGTDAPLVVKDKVLHRRFRRRVRRSRMGQRLRYQGRQTGVARLFRRARFRHADRSRKDHRPRQAGRQGFQHSSTWQGDQWKIGGGDTWGWYLVRSGTEPDLLRLRQSLDLEPEAAARRQQVVDDDLGARRRHWHGEVGLSDDAARRVGL